MGDFNHNVTTAFQPMTRVNPDDNLTGNDSFAQNETNITSLTLLTSRSDHKTMVFKFGQKTQNSEIKTPLEIIEQIGSTTEMVKVLYELCKINKKQPSGNFEDLDSVQTGILK